jgi:NADPH-dependent 2,4-dienoyl-CoA reductase/sulfur reductase-like enzyme/nitrite reductase/ring-hydroxylating ferredoxin subunit
MEFRLTGVELADGQMSQVDVGGRPLLLVRSDDAYHAYAAKCPHYQAPLADGLLHGGRLLCPLHQSVFDAASGDLREPPALDALPEFPVRVAEGALYVELPAEPQERRSPAMAPFDPDADPRLFAVIGGGAVAAAAVGALREGGHQGRILVVSPEDSWPYDRPNLTKDYLAGTAAEDWLPLRPASFYEDHGIERLRDRVTRLDVTARRLEFETSPAITPDAVLVATGATPRALSVPGAQLPGVFTLRSLHDCDELIAAAEGGRQAVVIGASFIGMEAAASLVQRGLEVTVTAPDETPFASTLGRQVGEAVRALHEAYGTRFRLARQVSRIAGSSRATGVVLDGGELLPADLVLVGVGVRPATGFVNGARLAGDGGIPVDEELRMAPDIWAGGDVARYPERHVGEPVRIEHWRLAEQHGRAAAFSMAGRGRTFEGVPFFWTQHFDFTLGFSGVGAGWSDTIVDGHPEERDFTVLYVKDGRLRAACGTRDRELDAFAELMRTGALPPASAVQGPGRARLQSLLG